MSDRQIGIPENRALGVSAALHNSVVQEYTDRVKELESALASERAKVVKRDAVIEEVRSWRKFWARESPILSSRAEFADLDGVLSQAPRDALAARDAVRDKTVRATALRDAAENADGVHSGMKVGTATDRIRVWLRARADQEEKSS